VSPYRSLALSLLAVTLVGVAGCQPLLTWTTEAGGVAGGGTSSPSGSAPGAEDEEEPLAGGASGVSTAQCLEGSWAIDKDSYAEFFSVVSGGTVPASDIEVTGEAIVEFGETAFSATYTAWEVRVGDPRGTMYQVMEGVEASTWSIDDSDVVTVAEPTSTPTQTLFVEMNGERIAMPMGTEVEGTVGSSSFTVICGETTLELVGPQFAWSLTRQ
jgi:hypothetical protein